MPSASGFVKTGAVLLAVLVAVTGYAALHPKVVSSAAASAPAQ